jgi:hypothetical protein
MAEDLLKEQGCGQRCGNRHHPQVWQMATAVAESNAWRFSIRYAVAEYVSTGSGRTLCSPPVGEEPWRNSEGRAHELSVCVELGTDEANGVMVLCGMVTQRIRDSVGSLYIRYR